MSIIDYCNCVSRVNSLSTRAFTVTFRSRALGNRIKDSRKIKFARVMPQARTYEIEG